MTEADKVTAELMALAKNYADAKVAYATDPRNFNGFAAERARESLAALEQAIRRAVDWEVVTHAVMLDGKFTGNTWESGEDAKFHCERMNRQYTGHRTVTPLYARNKP